MEGTGSKQTMEGSNVIDTGAAMESSPGSKYSQVIRNSDRNDGIESNELMSEYVLINNNNEHFLIHESMIGNIELNFERITDERLNQLFNYENVQFTDLSSHIESGEANSANRVTELLSRIESGEDNSTNRLLSHIESSEHCSDILENSDDIPLLPNIERFLHVDESNESETESIKIPIKRQKKKKPTRPCVFCEVHVLSGYRNI